MWCLTLLAVVVAVGTDDVIVSIERLHEGRTVVEATASVVVLVVAGHYSMIVLVSYFYLLCLLLLLLSKEDWA